MASRPPLPPAEFVARVGWPRERREEALAEYDSTGALQKQAIIDHLPSDWSFEGRRMLDFGSGAGRLLRHFYPEAETAELYGSDTDGEMITWLEANLCPPIAGGIVNGETPPLPFPDSHFDLVVAISVFTHITAHWAEWLVEMHRVLKPDGVLVATILNEGMSALVTPVPWDEDATGMNCFGYVNPYGGYPMVLHSRWWLREHWGRAFEIVELLPSGFAAPDGPGHGHGVVVARPRPVAPSVQELERDEPGEQRYARARRQNLLQLDADAAALRQWRGEQARSFEDFHRSAVESVARSYEGSRSWRLTAPVRRLGALLRRRTSRLIKR